MFHANRLRLQKLGTPYAYVSCRSCFAASCRSRPSLIQSVAVGGGRAYSDEAAKDEAANDDAPKDSTSPAAATEKPVVKGKKTATAREEPASTEKESAASKKPSATAKAAAARARSPRRATHKPPSSKTPKPKKTPKNDQQETSSIASDQPAGPDVMKEVLSSLQGLEQRYASINARLKDLQGGAPNPTIENEAADDKGIQRETNQLGQRLKIVSGTLDVLKSVLHNQHIPLDNLTKRSSTTTSSQATESEPDKKSKGTSASQKPRALESAETMPVRAYRLVASRETAKTEGAAKTDPAFLKTLSSSGWTTLASRLARGNGMSAAAPVDGSDAAVGALRSNVPTGLGEDTPKHSLDAVPRSPKRRRFTTPINVQQVKAHELELVPIDTPDQPAVPGLAYGLDRALFNPGVYQMQDPRSRVYNFDPYLSNIMPINEFDFNALKKYVTSSKDKTLVGLAAKLGKKYSGSTSSMTQLLSHFHYLLSAWRPLNYSTLSRKFNPEHTNFTQMMRAPAAAFLHLRGDGNVYAIDADKEYDNASILSMLGKSMEKLLTLPRDEFERYRRVNSDQITEEERNAAEAFHFTTMGDFLMRSQLDAYDPRLPGTGMFDLKTRSVISIRMDSQGFQKGLGYELRHRFGQWESFEREYFDMIRAAFMKYSLQVRMGRMDGIFVAFHNTQRIFGFQYISLEEMDLALHGTDNRSLGDQEFKLSLHLLNKVLDRATTRFPGRSIRLHIETRPSDPPFMYVFAKPVSQEEVDKVQTSNRVKVEEYESRLLGLAQREPEAEASESEADQSSGEEETVVGTDESKNQRWQTLDFWEEMRDKVEEAIEDDALGIEHVREAIQDALEQSGLLKARTPEEARGYVDGLLEALTRDEATETGDNEIKATEPSGTPSDESVALTADSTSGDELSTGEVAEPTSSEGASSDATAASAEAAETQPSQDGEATSSAEIEKGDLDARSSSDRGLKDLILRVATRADAKSEFDEAEVSDEDAVSDVSKLGMFERILSELVAKSKPPEDTTIESMESETGDVSPPAGEDIGGSLNQGTFSTESSSTDDAAEKEDEDSEIELDITGDEILGMHLTVRSQVNGKYRVRPDSKDGSWDWGLEYSIQEIPTEKAKSIYRALQTRRKQALILQPSHRDREWYKMFNGKLHEMSKKGREYRKEVTKTDQKSPVHVVGKEGPMTWDEAFSHQAEWQPQTWEKPGNEKSREK